jgi:hypothetical protein
MKVIADMNEASQWRLEVARFVATIIACNSKVQAIMLGGSASRGNADRYSDIEIGVFWSEDPTEADRMAPILPAGGVFWELDPYDERDFTWMEEWGLGGVKMDMRNLTLNGLQRIINAVREGDTGEFRQTALSAIQHGIPLFNEPLIQQWKARISEYPVRLGEAMVRENLELDEWCWWAELLAQRGDLSMAYSAFSYAAQNTLAILLGLNRIYHPGFKWVNRMIAEMTIKPQDLGARIERVFACAPIDAVPLLRDLRLETYDLIDAHMPQIETQAARTAFVKLRPQFPKMPESLVLKLSKLQNT